MTEAAGLAFPEPPMVGTPDCYRSYMARGAAAGDFDGDGDLDLFVARIGAADLFFVNDGSGTFVEAAAAAGLDHEGASNAALAFDLEGDGDLDLYVTALAPDVPRLYINDGSGRFAEEAAARGALIAPGECHAAWGASATDVDGDGDLDLHTTAWEAPFHRERNDRARLLLNDGAGHFTDGTLEADLSTEGRSSFTSAFGDLDGDGDVDLAL
ncbi:MAG: hypothetical protein GWO04_02080, partial [Actinobacteria bacterium]|nr:hypothetical protein [Actinomycetota bacterium]